MANTLEAETFYSNHKIARPLALKSRDHVETLTVSHSEGNGSPGEAWPWTVGGHRLPKKLCTYREPEITTSINRHRISTGMESLGSRAIGPGKLNDLVFLPSEKQMIDSYGLSCPQITPSVVGFSDPLKAPPVGQAHAMQVQVSEKRSAFREVTKRHTRGQGPQTCANAAQMRPHDGREPQTERLKNDPSFSRSESTVHNPYADTQPFYDATQQLLAMNSGIPHQHRNGIKYEQESSASSFIPLKRKLPMDFQNHTPGCDLLKNAKNTTGTNLYKESYALQFSSFQNGANAKQCSPSPFQWQPSLVPTSVLPLSPSVPGRQYDNWCAKCNASFRMTSDLVYHMRTQHKRSSVGTTRGGAANASSTSGVSADSFGGKRAEEKLKCDRCGETFRERHHLTRHMTSHNSDHE